MNIIRFGSALAVAGTLAIWSTSAFPQDGHGQDHGDTASATSESSQAYMEAMETMMDGMVSMTMTGDPDIDFAAMMIPHHQSAIDMAEAFLEYGQDSELRELAEEIISAQKAEIEFLRGWLDQNGG